MQVEKNKLFEGWLDVKTLAEALNVPPSWIYSRTRLTGPDQIPHLKVGKYRRFRLNAVLQWLEKQNDLG